MRLTLIISLLLAGLNWSYSQGVEGKSYELYSQKEWKQLIHFSDSVFETGTDYYYFRLRYAIAHFELGKYHKAIREFKKARSFNSAESVAQEYIYYCLLYQGLSDEALRYSKKLPVDTKARLDSLRKNEINIGFMSNRSEIPDSLGHVNILQASIPIHLGTAIKITPGVSSLTQQKSFGMLRQSNFDLQTKLTLSPHYSLNYSFNNVKSSILFTEYRSKLHSIGFKLRIRATTFAPYYGKGLLNNNSFYQYGMSWKQQLLPYNRLTYTGAFHVNSLNETAHYHQLDIKIHRRWYFSINASFGDIVYNNLLGESTVLNNSIDKTVFRFSPSIVYYGNNVNFWLGYQYTINQVYNQSIKYHYKGIYSGISLKF